MTFIRRPTRQIVSVLLLLVFLFSFLPIQGLAADNVYEAEIELTGKFTGTFDLSSSEMELFNLENIVPGDTWKGKLHVKNKASDKMEFAIISIVSNLEDNTLFDELDLSIYLDSKEIYNGSYGATVEPISEYYIITAGKEITFDLVVSLPKTAGNNIQNKKMDSTWTFEARYYGGDGGSTPVVGTGVNYTVHYVDEDGNELLEHKTGRGEYMSWVTEQAPEIEGYTPDKQEKRLLLRKVGNKIVFIYSPIDENPDDEPTDPTTPDDPGTDDPKEPGDIPTEPTTPSEPGTSTPGTSDKTPEKPATGHDMTDSNSTTAVWIICFGLCLIATGIVIFRIKQEKKQLQKEGSKHVEK